MSNLVKNTLTEFHILKMLHHSITVTLSVNFNGILDNLTNDLKDERAEI